MHINYFIYTPIIYNKGIVTKYICVLMHFFIKNNFLSVTLIEVVYLVD